MLEVKFSQRYNYIKYLHNKEAFPHSVSKTPTKKCCFQRRCEVGAAEKACTSFFFLSKNFTLILIIALRALELMLMLMSAYTYTHRKKVLNQDDLYNLDSISFRIKDNS